MRGAELELIARDPGLPLATLLDDAALSAWLSASSRDAATARRRYLRYKPGASCLVLADVQIAGAQTQVVITGVAAAGRPKVAKAMLRARGDDLLAADPDAGLVAVRPAADRHLPGLRWLLRRPERMLTRLLGRPIRVVGVTTLAYKPQRRWVGRVDLEGRPPVLVRCYRAGTLREQVGIWRRLGAAGLPVADVLGVEENLDTVALSWTVGDVLDDVARTAPERLSPAVVGAGGVLAQLHERPALGERTLSEPALRRASTAVAVVLPAVAEEAALLAAEIAARTPRGGDTVLAHGDFSLDQIVIGPDGPVLLDLDRAVPASPATDLGSAAAALLADPAVARNTATVVPALLAGYGEVRRIPSDGEIAVATAGALLGRAVEPFRHCRPDWPDHVTRTIRVAAAVLEQRDALAGAA